MYRKRVYAFCLSYMIVWWICPRRPISVIQRMPLFSWPFHSFMPCLEYFSRQKSSSITLRRRKICGWWPHRIFFGRLNTMPSFLYCCIRARWREMLPTIHRWLYTKSYRKSHHFCSTPIFTTIKWNHFRFMCCIARKHLILVVKDCLSLTIRSYFRWVWFFRLLAFFSARFSNGHYVLYGILFWLHFDRQSVQEHRISSFYFSLICHLVAIRTHKIAY